MRQELQSVPNTVCRAGSGQSTGRGGHHGRAFPWVPWLGTPGGPPGSPLVTAHEFPREGSVPHQEPLSAALRNGSHDLHGALSLP